MNNAALSYEPETLGETEFGFRYGILGLLYMKIVQELLSREHDLDLIVTAPSVAYEVAVGSEGNKKTIIEDTPK